MYIYCLFPNYLAQFRQRQRGRQQSTEATGVGPQPEGHGSNPTRQASNGISNPKLSQTTTQQSSIPKITHAIQT
jgi:hypothetical protein